MASTKDKKKVDYKTKWKQKLDEYYKVDYKTLPLELKDYVAEVKKLGTNELEEFIDDVFQSLKDVSIKREKTTNKYYLLGFLFVLIQFYHPAEIDIWNMKIKEYYIIPPLFTAAISFLLYQYYSASCYINILRFVYMEIVPFSKKLYFKHDFNMFLEPFEHSIIEYFFIVKYRRFNFPFSIIDLLENLLRPLPFCIVLTQTIFGIENNVTSKTLSISSIIISIFFILSGFISSFHTKQILSRE